MKIVECLWKDQFVEKLEQKHQVSVDEVEEVFSNAPRYDFIAKGRGEGENVYRALGQTDAGRYLAVFFINKHGGMALPISARNMDAKERRRYGKK
ncbi:MAG: BrnT family toxin [Blastocatellia bacterium]